MADGDRRGIHGALRAVRGPWQSVLAGALTVVATLSCHTIGERLHAEESDPALAMEFHLIRLGDDDPDIRADAAHGLAALGGVPGFVERAVPVLLEAARDPLGAVRCGALRALAVESARSTPGVAEALADGLQDDEEVVRQQAATGLRLCGEHAAGAVSRLARALRDRSPAVRVLAAQALAAIGPRAAAALPALLDGIKDLDDRVGSAAAVALGAIGPGAVPELLRSLRDGEPTVRIRACDALRGQGRAAAAAVPQLMLALRDEEPKLKRSATWTLAEIGPEAAVAIPDLVMALGAADAHTRVGAALALGRLETAEGLALTTLERLVEHDAEAEVREAAAEAVARIRAGIKRGGENGAGR